MDEKLWDIIVLGAGTAGLPCAVAAAERGARVVVVEKTGDIGGTLHVTGGHLSAGGARRQRARGIADSPDLHYDDVMRICRHTADPEIVRLAVDEAPKTIDWLEDLGFEFEPQTPVVMYGHEPYRQPRTYWGVENGKSVLKVLRPLWDKCVAGGQVTPLLNHEFTGFITDGGAVTGARVRDAGGAEFELQGRAVVVTTGGYGSNREFFNAVTPGPPPLFTAAQPASTGDGIRAALRLGARFHNAGKHLAALGGIEVAPGRADWNGPWAMIYSPVYRPPREIYVNADGLRFLAEDEPSPDVRESVLRRQPRETCWLIFDETALNDAPPLVRGWSPDDLRARAALGHIAWRADSIAELANTAGLPPEALRRTVDSFNEGVRAGQDALGRKDVAARISAYSLEISEPPFYALETRLTTFVTFGGLATDANLRVLREDGAIIPNLYAAGEALGAGATSGDAFCGGMLLTPALSFGRLLGQRLARVSA
jgi:fumarate reductase flavoprotein subunit